MRAAAECDRIRKLAVRNNINTHAFIGHHAIRPILRNLERRKPDEDVLFGLLRAARGNRKSCGSSRHQLYFCLACPRSVDGNAPLVNRGPIELLPGEAPKQKRHRQAAFRCKAGPENPEWVRLAGKRQQQTALLASPQVPMPLSFDLQYPPFATSPFQARPCQRPIPLRGQARLQN
jgi:hypothetical protein